jgi:hypothetical protein
MSMLLLWISDWYAWFSTYAGITKE